MAKMVPRIVKRAGILDRHLRVDPLGERFWTDTDKLVLVRQYDGIFGPTKKGVPRPT